MSQYVYLIIGILSFIFVYFIVTYLFSSWIPYEPGDNVPNQIYQIAKHEPITMIEKKCFITPLSFHSQTFGVSFFLFVNQIGNPNPTSLYHNIVSIGDISSCSVNSNQNMSNSLIEVKIENSCRNLMIRLSPSSDHEFELDDDIPFRKPVHYFLQCIPRGNIMMFNIFRNGEFIKSRSIHGIPIRTGINGMSIQTGSHLLSPLTYSTSIQRLYLFEKADELTIQDIQSLSKDRTSFSI
jgi:hypothetical protein